MLEKGNISLRAPEPEDIDFLLIMENDTSLWNVSNTHNPFSRFDIEQYVLLADKDIYSAKQLRFIIENIESSNPVKVGVIDIFDFDGHNRRAGIGIMIIEKEQNKGHAGIALDILISFMFSHINIHQLYCNIGVENNPSIKLFESRGFNLVGIKKDWNLVGNKWADEYIYQLIDLK
ncbi:MAG: GNAT family N-acetyltransferase [Bacteroidetes bacterium]|nr:GNAT family N-acetyltransferase [Bacteroidota bacterium]